MNSSVMQTKVVKVNGSVLEEPDLLAVEEPLEIRLGFGPASCRQQRSISVTMRTPGNDYELALGFLFTEGIIFSFDQVESIHYCQDAGKAKFTINAVPDHQLAADDFLMMTIRSHDQYNTTIYGLHDRYRGIHYHRRVVLMNEKDMARLQLHNQDVVDLISVYDGVERVASGFLAVSYSIPAQCVATYFPEANVLVPHNRSAGGSNQPISKSVVIKIRRGGSTS